MLFLTTIESVVSIVLIIALGFYLQKAGWFANTFASNISKLIMNIALPASIFNSVLTYLNRDKLVSLSDGLLYGAISIVLGYLIAWLLVKVMKIRRGRRGVFINTIVNANTIFIGLPLNIALFGNVSMPYFLVYYVLNTISTWAFGAILIAHDSNTPQKTEQAQHIDWKKLLPAPLIGFLIALVFLLADIPVPSFIHTSLNYIGSIVTPLSLIYIGIVLCNAGLNSINFDKDTVVALIGKFILAPVIMVTLILLGENALPLPLMEEKTLIVQSAIPALAILPILANEAKGDVQFATNIVTTSTLLFIIVIPIVETLLKFL
ncbi:AEC family transporter [Rodentibacter trehalosifermentans]|uniref:Malate permease n=1 Tax=Rodentibacter trehalosifermentans TaxID=1908263 RepID=A0A1V3J1Z3_9PAST|nr:AEC family transporter [Rodentibacter trehalosifermentans]OOF47323.1 malate permease [Rodentibacter trehalosifermentans]OOF47610.1 malate permease [Rodentibacter trehalosifermentans]OOF49040.1 malate permease [Rodentibacter trehalosifermentans]